MKRVELDDLLREEADNGCTPFPSIEAHDSASLGKAVPVGLLAIDFVLVHTNPEALEPRYGFRPSQNLALDFYEALYLVLQDKLIVEATKVRDEHPCRINQEPEMDKEGRSIYDTLGIQGYDPKDTNEDYYTVTALQLYEHACKSCNRFCLIYPVYHGLAMKNWYIRSGLNYGTEFILYSTPPGTTHSTYAVAVHERGEELLAARVFGMVRVCVGAVKKLVLAVAGGRLGTKYEDEQELRNDIVRIKIKMMECSRWDPKMERMRHGMSKQLDELSLGRESEGEENGSDNPRE